MEQDHPQMNKSAASIAADNKNLANQMAELNLQNARDEEAMLMDNDSEDEFEIVPSMDASKSTTQVRYTFDITDEKSSLPMTFEDKQQLLLAINNLPAQYIPDVVNIIKANERQENGGVYCEEMQINFEALDVTTLRELEAYVRAALDDIEENGTTAFSHVSVLGKKQVLPKVQPPQVVYNVNDDKAAKPMSYRKLQRLACNIHKLPLEYMPQIVSIVEKGENLESVAKPKDLEIDFEMMQPKTLRELEAYVSAAFKHIEATHNTQLQAQSLVVTDAYEMSKLRDEMEKLKAENDELKQSLQKLTTPNVF